MNIKLNWAQLFLQRARLKHNNEYDYTEVKYSRASVKVSIRCLKHGIFQQRPNDHLRGNGCPSCGDLRTAASKRGNKDDFIKRTESFHGTTYQYDQVVYKNAVTKVTVVCKQHGPFFVTPDKHLTGIGCPKCSNTMSCGERKIQNYLMKCGIKFTREKSFPDLIGRTPNSRLRYDFFLPDYNVLVEYDGQHHFSPIRIKGRLTTAQSIEKHRATKRNDKKKNRYAAKKGIALLRIKYTEFSLTEVVLQEFLARHRANHTEH